MASSILAGFVKGYTGYQLDDIQRRKQMEAEEKKARLLQQMQMETAEYEYKMREPERKHKQDLELAAEERAKAGEARNAAMHPLDLEAKRASIDSSRASAQYSRAAARAAGTKASLDGSKAGEDENFDIANELMYRYSKEVEDAIKAGGISRNAVRQGAVAFAQNSRTGSEMQAKFLDWLADYQTGRKATAQGKREKPLGF